MVLFTQGFHGDACFCFYKLKSFLIKDLISKHLVMVVIPDLPTTFGKYKKINSPRISLSELRGDSRSRTDDPLLAKQML